MQTRQLLGLTLVLILGLGGPAHGVTVCYDYVTYLLTGKDPRPVGDPNFQGTGALDVMAVLKGDPKRNLPDKGYKALPRMPVGDLNDLNVLNDKGNKLIAKDVIFIGGHVGYVAGPNSIYHFLQVEGTSRTNAKYDVCSLPKHRDLGSKRGGLFERSSLKEFLKAPFSPPTSYEVWRSSNLVALATIGCFKDHCCPLWPFAGTWKTFGGTGNLGLQVTDAAHGQKSVAFYSGGSANCGTGTTYYTGDYSGSTDSGQVAACTDGTGRHLMGWYKSDTGEQHGTISIAISSDLKMFTGSYVEQSSVGTGVPLPYSGTFPPN